MIYAHRYSCVVFVKPLEMANNGRLFIWVQISVNAINKEDENAPLRDFLIF